MALVGGTGRRPQWGTMSLPSGGITLQLWPLSLLLGLGPKQPVPLISLFTQALAETCSVLLG